MSDAEDLSKRRARFIRRRRAKRRQAAMTVIEHLKELRRRLVVSAVAFAAISVVVFIFYEPILELFKEPYCDLPSDVHGPQGCTFPFTGVLGGFQFRLKLTAIVALALSSPIWLYQLWAFLVPAFTPKEKRYALPFLGTSIVLFLVGASLAYLTIPTGLKLLLTIGGDDLFPFITANEYISFVGLMLLAFGLTFELPVVLIFLGLAGAVTVEQLRKGRRVAAVAIAVLAAVATPSGDPYTMTVLAAPLYLLYEATILVLSRLKKKRDP